VISDFRHKVDLVAYYAASSGGFFSKRWGPIDCPETSIRNYHNSLLEPPEGPSYSTPKFIAVLTTARYLFLSSARLIQSTSFPSELKIHFNIILPSTPRSSKCHSNRFPRQNPVCISLSYVPHAWHISFLI